MSDLCVYWGHRLQHRVDFLWRFHAIHHSAEHLDWLAAHREHPLDTVYTATMITSQGVITFQLKADLAPIAVNNFVLLANLGFYDNTPVNLISDDNFVILGAPANKPESDAGYSLKPEMELPVEPKAGLLAYVPKTNDPSSASSSQLFITLGNPGPQAPKQYSFFGEITSGLEVVQALTTADTVQSITIEK